MLTKVEKSELSRRNPKRSPIREFADEAAREFVEVSSVGDVFEVTGAPECERGVQAIAEALRSALFYMEDGKDISREVRVMTRGGKRVFMERLEPPAQRSAPWRWPN